MAGGREFGKAQDEGLSSDELCLLAQVAAKSKSRSADQVATPRQDGHSALPSLQLIEQLRSSKLQKVSLPELAEMVSSAGDIQATSLNQLSQIQQPQWLAILAPSPSRKRLASAI